MHVHFSLCMKGVKEINLPRLALLSFIIRFTCQHSVVQYRFLSELSHAAKKNMQLKK